MYFGFKNITVKYGNNTILDDISLDIPKGKISTIIGPNGSGKSSLLKLIARKSRPHSGEIIYQDKSIYDYNTKEIAKKISYLPQIHKSPTDNTVRMLVSNGRFPYRTLLGSLSPSDEEIIDEVLRFTGLYEIQDRMIRNLSGGERQRAWIAMAMAATPDILVLDEPTTYLDIMYQIEIMDLVTKLKEKYDRTILLVLHDLNLAIKYSDYIFAIKDRKVIVSGEKEEIITTENLKRIFDIDSKILHHDDDMVVIPERRIL